MEKGRGERADTLQTDNVFTHKEYIEREAAIVAIKNLYPGIPLAKIRLQKWHEENKNFMECELAIERIPAADVVPVVRCADCKWFQINMRQDGYLPKGVPECECRHWCGACDPTDFCSYGARMDGDSDGV